MKTIRILLLCFAWFRIIAADQFNSYLQLDQNGLVTFSGFFASNQVAINAVVTNTVSGGGGVSLTVVTNLIAGKQNQQFPLSFTNLTAYIGAGSIYWPNGKTLDYEGGNIGLFAYFTNYLVLNYATGKPHILYRFLGGGGEHLLAVIMTGATGVTTVYQNNDFTGMASRIGQAKSKLLAIPNRFDISLLGDSLTESSGTGIMWKDLLFNSAQSTNGFNVPNVGAVVVRNFGLGGMNADYGLALMSRSAQSFGYPYQGYGGHGTALDMAGNPGGTSALKTYTPQSGFSTFWKTLPDLVIVGFGVNAGATGYGSYSSQDLECIGRALQERGVPTLYTTENDFYGSALSSQTTASNVAALASGLGGAVADTAAYVDEINRRGLSTYADSVHQNQYGWNAWAEAILGVLNQYAQRTMTVTPLPNRIIDTTSSAEAPYSGFGMTFVGGTSINASAGVTKTNNAYSGSTSLAGAFGQTTVYCVPGTSGSVTNYVDYYHSCWSSAQLVFERGVGSNGTGTNSFSGYSAWIDNNGAEHVMKTFSFSDDNNGAGIGPYPRPGMLDAASISQVLPAITNLTVAGIVVGDALKYWNNGCIRIGITSGNARILGVVFRGPRHRKLALKNSSDIISSSAWFDDTLDPYGWYPHTISTDTVGETLGIRFRGKGVQVSLRGSTAAGQIAIYGSGKLIATAELYSAGRPGYVAQWMPGIATSTDSSKGDIDGDYLLIYTGNNNSRVSQSFGYHGITIFDAIVIY